MNGECAVCCRHGLSNGMRSSQFIRTVIILYIRIHFTTSDAVSLKVVCLTNKFSEVSCVPVLAKQSKRIMTQIKISASTELAGEANGGF